MQSVVANIGLGWMQLEPLFATRRWIGIGLTGYRGRQFQSVGHGCPQKMPAMIFRINCGVVPAGQPDVLNDFRVKGHRFNLAPWRQDILVILAQHRRPLMMALFRQPPLRIQCRHAPRARRSDRLLVVIVRHVTGGENAFDAGIRPVRLDPLDEPHIG
jgi:hypothetical protein